MAIAVAKWLADKPYNDLPRLPPQADVETRAVLKQCITARAALGELKQAALRIPNQGMLINTLPLLEARASSEIENIVTTTDKLFRNVGSEDHADPATKEALRYGRALFEGFKTLNEHPLSTRTAERICSTIKGVEMTVRKVPGTALVNNATKEIVYTPPENENRLRDLLANWEQYIHAETDVDPLIRLAIGHYQFEAIHPFTDGNGRTGRVLNSLFLIQEGLLTLPILYLSRYIIENQAGYYRLLRNVTSDKEWEPWLLYIIKGVEETANWTTAKIDAINALSIHNALCAQAPAQDIQPRADQSDFQAALLPYKQSDLRRHRQTANRLKLSEKVNRNRGARRNRDHQGKALCSSKADCSADNREQRFHALRTTNGMSQAVTVHPDKTTVATRS